MTWDPDWRPRARAALEAYFRRRSFPRLTLSLLLLITGMAGFLASYGMLHAGLTPMWVRYPLAVLVGYAVLLGLIRLWVEVERARFDPLDADIESSRTAQREATPVRSQVRERSWFDWIDIPTVDLFDGDEGCLLGILAAVVVTAMLAVLTAIAAAPVLIAEAFLDAFLVAILYRHLRVAQREHWLGAALRRTWLLALLTAGALAIGGWALEELAPGAPSIGKAVEQLRR